MNGEPNTFLGTHPIELVSVSGASGYEVLTGQVNVIARARP